MKRFRVYFEDDIDSMADVDAETAEDAAETFVRHYDDDEAPGEPCGRTVICRGEFEGYGETRRYRVHMEYVRSYLTLPE